MDITRSSLRLLAPIALVGFAIAMLVVITSTTGGGTPSPTRTSLEKQRDLGTSAPSSGRARLPGRRPRATYTVRSGDTLAAIAQRTGVPVSRLQQLNPGVDPRTLLAGQKLKLR